MEEDNWNDQEDVVEQPRSPLCDDEFWKNGDGNDDDDDEEEGEGGHRKQGSSVFDGDFWGQKDDGGDVDDDDGGRNHDKKNSPSVALEALKEEEDDDEAENKHVHGKKSSVFDGDFWGGGENADDDDDEGGESTPPKATNHLSSIRERGADGGEDNPNTTKTTAQDLNSTLSKGASHRPNPLEADSMIAMRQSEIREPHTSMVTQRSMSPTKRTAEEEETKYGARAWVPKSTTRKASVASIDSNLAASNSSIAPPPPPEEEYDETAPPTPLSQSLTTAHKRTPTLQTYASTGSVPPPPPPDTPTSPISKPGGGGGGGGGRVPPPAPPEGDSEEESDDEEPPPPIPTKEKNKRRPEGKKAANNNTVTATKQQHGGVSPNWQGFLPRGEAKELGPLPGIKRSDGKDAMQEVRTLLKSISDARIFTKSLQVSANDLQDFIIESGSVINAQITVAILKSQGHRPNEWKDFKKLLQTEEVSEFKTDIRKIAAKMLGKGNFYDIAEPDLDVLMAMAIKYDIGYLQDVMQIAGGPLPVPSFRYIFYSTQGAFSKQIAFFQEERQRLINFLTANPLFRENIQVKNDDLMNVCKGVLFSKPGISAGVRVEEILKIVAQGKESFNGFGDLVKRIKEVCATYKY